MEIIGKKERLIGCYATSTNNYSDGAEILSKNFFKNFPDDKFIFNNKFIQKFKSEDIAVNCETYEEAKEFCECMDRYDLNWFSNQFDDIRFEYYKENTCYEFKQYRMYSPIIFFKEEGYTIIKFKDLIFENNSNTKEETMKEFIEYWKNNKVAVKFTKGEDKEKFCLMIDGTASDQARYVSPDSNCVVFNYKTWMHCDESYYKEIDYRIINYEDIKNWREILMKKEEKKYELTGKYTLKDILNASPCEDEFEEFCMHLKESGFSYKEICQGNIKIVEQMLDLDVAKNNINWLLEKGFVEEVKEIPELKIGQKWKDLKNSTGFWRVIEEGGKLKFLNLTNFTIYGDTSTYKEWIHTYELIEE